MTPSELDAIQARADAATAGPWFFHHLDDRNAMNTYVVTTSDDQPDMWSPSYRDETVICGTLIQSCMNIAHRAENWYEDADFIRHARTDIPALVAEVRRLRESLEAILKHQRFVGGALASFSPVVAIAERALGECK